MTQGIKAETYIIYSDDLILGFAVRDPRKSKNKWLAYDAKGSRPMAGRRGVVATQGQLIGEYDTLDDADNAVFLHAHTRDGRIEGIALD